MATGQVLVPDCAIRTLSSCLYTPTFWQNLKANNNIIISGECLQSDHILLAQSGHQGPQCRLYKMANSNSGAWQRETRTNSVEIQRAEHGNLERYLILLEKVTRS